MKCEGIFKLVASISIGVPKCKILPGLNMQWLLLCWIMGTIGMQLSDKELAYCAQGQCAIVVQKEVSASSPGVKSDSYLL